ncbi:MAG TPA: hypothetical protein DD633_00780, partial [Sphaerochaeta sp.]|nr:hypothetical protein [Sphaerochaeta sp.]
GGMADKTSVKDLMGSVAFKGKLIIADRGSLSSSSSQRKSSRPSGLHAPRCRERRRMTSSWKPGA